MNHTAALHKHAVAAAAAVPFPPAAGAPAPPAAPAPAASGGTVPTVPEPPPAVPRQSHARAGPGQPAAHQQWHQQAGAATACPVQRVARLPGRSQRACTPKVTSARTSRQPRFPARDDGTRLTQSHSTTPVIAITDGVMEHASKLHYSQAGGASPPLTCGLTACAWRSLVSAASAAFALLRSRSTSAVSCCTCWLSSCCLRW